MIRECSSRNEIPRASQSEKRLPTQFTGKFAQLAYFERFSKITFIHERNTNNKLRNYFNFFCAIHTRLAVFMATLVEWNDCVKLLDELQQARETNATNKVK